MMQSRILFMTPNAKAQLPLRRTGLLRQQKERPGQGESSYEKVDTELLGACSLKLHRRYVAKR